MDAAFFALPGIGPLLVAGPLITWIVGVLERAIGGLSAVGGPGSTALAFRKTRLKLETALGGDKSLV